MRSKSTKREISNETTARISLVMPCYNHGRFIAQALEALFAQTRPADEIIVIDDGSTDDSLAVVRALANGRNNVSVLRNKENRGVLWTLNRGLARASGDLIAFPAADDAIRPSFLEESARTLQRFPLAPFCSACVELIDAGGKPIGRRPILRPTRTIKYADANFARSILERGDNFFFGNVSLYRRKRLLDLGGFDTTLAGASDGMMMRRMAVRWGFCFIPEVLGAWRLHDTNYSTSTIDSAENLDELITLNQKMIAAEPMGLFPKNYSDVFERRLRFNVARLTLLGRSRQSSEEQAMDTLCKLVHASQADRAVLRMLRRLAPASYFLSMAWLTIRLRPMSLTWLGGEILNQSISQAMRSRLPAIRRMARR